MLTKMRFLACSLADGVLADAILISPCPTLLPTNIAEEGKGSLKKIRKPVTEKTFTSK